MGHTGESSNYLHGGSSVLGNGSRFVEYQQFQSLRCAAERRRRRALQSHSHRYVDGLLYTLHLPASVDGEQCVISNRHRRHRDFERLQQAAMKILMFTLCLNVPTNGLWTLESSHDLTTWAPRSFRVMGSNVWEITAGERQEFFRLKQLL